MVDSTHRAAGRPRSSEADSAIIEAAARLLRSEGYAGVSMERIAAEAGVGKTTVYRRYKDRQALAAAAAAQMASHPPYEPAADVDLRTGLVRAVEHLDRAAGSPPVLSMLGVLLAERQQQPKHLERFWAHVFDPHRNAMLAVLEQGVRAGEIGPGTRRDAVADSLIGSFLARHLSGAPVTPGWIDSTVDTLTDGISTSKHTSTGDA